LIWDDICEETMLDLNDPTIAAELEDILAQVREEIKPLTEPIRQSKILTARDYMVRFNPCPLEYSH